MNRYARQNYVDIDISSVDPFLHPICQLKYDGIWCCCDVDEARNARYYSRNGQLKLTENLSQYGVEPGAYIGELMFGSEWAQDPSRKGKFFVFDQVEHRSVCWKASNYLARYSALTRHLLTFPIPHWSLVQIFNTTDSLDIWKALVEKELFEGLVFRKWEDPWDVTLFRAKYELTEDLYVIGFEEGEGRLKGSLGSLIASGSKVGLPPLHKIGGGMSDKLRKEIWTSPSRFLGRCFEVTAKKKFASGQLRHPNFKCWRDDKS